MNFASPYQTPETRTGEICHVSPAVRWYGPELYFDRFELRSRDDSRVLARAAGGRVGLDLWQFLRSGKLFALRIEVDAPDLGVDRLGPSTFAVAAFSFCAIVLRSIGARALLQKRLSTCRSAPCSPQGL